MNEAPFQVAVGDGVLHGHIGGSGAPALLLHGGPALPDYMAGCAAELTRLFSTIRYTQRGVEPSTVGSPYSVESHMADALAVLDALGLEQAWAVGHSWGGHLALHLAVAHPDRLYGVVCIDTLGATADGLAGFEEKLLGPLDETARARYDEIEERYKAGEATAEELVEQHALVWPNYFFDPAGAPPPLVDAIGVECFTQTFRSVMEHFEAGTLATGLPALRMPALFAHGIDDPLSLQNALDSAKLIPGAKVGRIPRCGHFPWLEQPGFLDRMLRGLIAHL